MFLIPHTPVDTVTIRYSTDAVKNLSDQEVEQFRQRKGVQCYGLKVPKPCQSIGDLICLSEALHKQLAVEMQEPEPVQSQVWPVLLSGRDVVVVGSTEYALALEQTCHDRPDTPIQSSEG